MSLFGLMNTAVSGLSAQASYLSTISDNVSNSSTVGYKEAETQFETLLGDSTPSNYSSGGVQTDVRYGITGQGTINGTSSSTDLAISGNGFFVVSGSDGSIALTRAGSFVPDSSGNLINTAGYYLMGYPLSNGATSTTDTGLTALQKVNVTTNAELVTPSTSGTYSANLPSTATVVAAGSLPSDNVSTSSYTEKTTITAYDDLGNSVTLDVYATKIADTASGSATDDWQIAVYNHADATNGGFPYTSGGTNDTPLNGATGTTLNFDPTTGALSTANPASATSTTIAVPASTTSPATGAINFSLDLSSMTQVASAYTVNTATTNGSAPSKLSSTSIGSNGVLSFVYANGTSVPKYQIPVADVESPDNLTPVVGNAYQVNSSSGAISTGSAGQGGLGKIDSSSLEASTVDLATELTNMIQAQQAYQANSKVLQTGSDLMSVINNLK